MLTPLCNAALTELESKLHIPGHAGLRSKEENMRELVRLAEVREARAKEEMAGLLSARSTMFESAAPVGEAEAADYATFEARIDDAKRRKALAKKKFNKLRAVCIGAQQVCLYT